MKCPVCHKNKAKRVCRVMGGSICPSCCADIREDACDQCNHYQVSLAYQRDKVVALKKFTTEIIPQVDDECDEALALVERGDIEGGQKILEKLDKAYPRYHTVRYGLGVCCALQQRFDEAIAYFEQAVEILPIFAAAYCNLGAAYCKKVEIEKAVAAYESAVRFADDDGSIKTLARKGLDALESCARTSGISLSTYIRNKKVFDRGFTAMCERRTEDAIELFERVLATDSRHVQSHGNLGIAYGSLGKKQKALEHLNKALEIDPEYEPAMINRIGIQSLEEGESFQYDPSKQMSYYSEFKLQGRSLAQEILDTDKSENRF